MKFSKLSSVVSKISYDSNKFQTFSELLTELDQCPTWLEIWHFLGSFSYDDGRIKVLQQLMPYFTILPIPSENEEKRPNVFSWYNITCLLNRFSYGSNKVKAVSILVESEIEELTPPLASKEDVCFLLDQLSYDSEKTAVLDILLKRKMITQLQFSNIAEVLEKFSYLSAKTEVAKNFISLLENVKDDSKVEEKVKKDINNLISIGVFSQEMIEQLKPKLGSFYNEILEERKVREAEEAKEIKNYFDSTDGAHGMDGASAIATFSNWQAKYIGTLSCSISSKVNHMKEIAEFRFSDSIITIETCDELGMIVRAGDIISHGLHIFGKRLMGSLVSTTENKKTSINLMVFEEDEEGNVTYGKLIILK